MLYHDRLNRALRRHARLLKGIAGLVLFFALWQLSVPLIGLSEYFYPSPRRVAQSFVELIEKGILPVYVLDSIGRYASSVAIGTLIGVSLGLMIGLSRAVSRVLGPLINFMYAIVEGAWIPLFVVWWGYGFKVIIVLLIYIMVFPLLYNTIVGVRAIPQIYINAVRTLGASPFQILINVILPAALPNIITGFRVGAGFAFRGLIFAEMLAAKTGIGYLIYEGASAQNTARTIVGMLCMGVLWLAIDRIYLRPFERATVERWGIVVTAARQG
ncbi:MAG: ABC transporter permease [Proteobacteria bacterium]|nr:ABC transporter permease [Pseudomonadota bacterium]MBI3498071.1 ABC transporter permease [Pseudomonadota bacterium]